MTIAIQRLSTVDADFAAKLKTLLAFEAAADDTIERTVATILADVKTRGDAAVVDYSNRFDRLSAASMADLELSRDELEKALQKLKAMVLKKESLSASVLHFIQNLTQGHTSLDQKYKEIFLVDYRNQKLPVPVKDIALFHKEAVNAIYLFSGEKYHLDSISLDEVETQLDPKRFFRVNRQTIVDIDAIQSIKSQENATIDLTLKKPHDKLEITVSRSRCPDFRKWMNR